MLTKRSPLPPLALAGAAVALFGCAATVTPVVAVPGPNTTMQAFQKDEAGCRAAAAQAASPGGANANANARWAAYFASYTQCAQSHGDQVQPVPWAVANVGFGYPYGPYGYAYPPYPVYGYGYAPY